MRSLALAPQHDPTFWMLIASNAQFGRFEEARAISRRSESSPRP
jgi:hypothetical protein